MNMKNFRKFFTETHFNFNNFMGKFQYFQVEN